jgi:hypothetical protein
MLLVPIAAPYAALDPNTAEPIEPAIPLPPLNAL